MAANPLIKWGAALLTPADSRRCYGRRPVAARAESNVTPACGPEVEGAMTEPAATPAIPDHLRHLPVVGGLAVPAIAARLSTGARLFGTPDDAVRQHMLTERRCQVCARPLDTPLVLLLRDRDLTRQCTAEPALHEACMRYATAACPMIAGRMTHYRSSVRNLRGEAEHGPDVQERLGRPAEPWHAVWLDGYQVITDPEIGITVASFAGVEPVRREQVFKPAGWIDEADIQDMLAPLKAMFGDWTRPPTP